MLHLARQHGQAPRVLKALTDAQAEAVPDGVLARLRADFAHAAGANLMLAGELLALLAEFDRADIPVIPFKGPLLAATLYGDVALRPFSDLDLLIRRRDLPGAREVLRASGYRRGDKPGLVPDDALLRGASGEDHQKGVFAVDLQWRIAKQVFAVASDPEQIWARAVPAGFMGREVRTLAPEDLLQLLVVHGSRHAWERLTWICDVAEILRREDGTGMNWGVVRQETERNGTARMLRVALALAHDTLGAPLPPEVRLWVAQDSAAIRLAREAAQRLFGRPLSRAEYGRFQLRLREGAAAKTRLVVSAAFTPGVEDYTAVRLPAKLHSLYRLVRPFRLLRQYAPTPFRCMGRRA